MKQELAHKIESNTQQLNTIAAENKFLRKENDLLKDRLAKIEQNQLGNNIIITGIQEGPFEPYQTTKLRVQEMIAVTIDSGDAVANEEYPLHVKHNRDRLCPILKLAKSIPQYREKSRLEEDQLVINGICYGVDDISNLPNNLAAYHAAEKSNDTHIVFAGELSPYSNFHPSTFIINGQKFHSGEQWVQYKKALTFGDSFIANKILNSETAIECK